MDLRRKIENELVEWKNRPSRQPLLLLGARQVGKTYTAHHFGENNFPSVVTVNFQTDLPRLLPLFEGQLEPRRILEEIGYLTGTVITPDTLVIFDEVQLCPAAVTSLKYFAEQTPAQAIIATGSLFGISVNRQERYSFPVGKVDLAHMFPLDFEEFLWAAGQPVQADGIRASVHRREPFIGHDDAIRSLRQYLMTGGLPRVVGSFLQSVDWAETRRLQRDLATLYVADMALYASAADAVRTRSIWESIPRQLTRETSHKFKLTDIKAGARFHQYDTSFAWLETAGLIHRHYQTEQPVAPLRPRENGTFFKAYLLDTGILSAQLGVVPQVFCSESGYAQISPAFRGGIAENYVKQALAAAGIDSMYWSSGNTAEVDFLLTDSAMRVIPMEVKSGDNARSRSLAAYQASFHPKLAIRLSTKNIGLEKDLLSLPLYAAFCLPGVLGTESAQRV